MEIHIEQTTDYPYDLLLLADPNRELVDRYLKASDCLVALCEGQAVGVIVVQKQSINGAEVLNLAVGEPENLHFINVTNKLKKNYPSGKCMRVRSVCPLSNDVILVGTTDGLISFSSQFDNPEDIHFYLNYCEPNRENSLSDNDVMHILETSDGEVYSTTVVN